MKKTGKLLGILLTVSLVCTPVSATQASRLDIMDIDTSSLSVETPVVMNEEIALREQSAKHFLLSDGSYSAVVYDRPIHYMKGNEWVDIDNSLVSASLVGEPHTGVIKRDTELTATKSRLLHSISRVPTIRIIRLITKITRMILKFSSRRGSIAIRRLPSAMRGTLYDSALMTLRTSLRN